MKGSPDQSFESLDCLNHFPDRSPGRQSRQCLKPFGISLGWLLSFGWESHCREKEIQKVVSVIDFKQAE
jgi:hypothetical protein